jgi:hypothetical protein
VTVARITPLAGSGPAVVVPNGWNVIAVDSNNVYWADWDGAAGAVMKAPRLDTLR